MPKPIDSNTKGYIWGLHQVPMFYIRDPADVRFISLRKMLNTWEKLYPGHRFLYREGKNIKSMHMFYHPDGNPYFAVENIDGSKGKWPKDFKGKLKL